MTQAYVVSHLTFIVYPCTSELNEKVALLQSAVCNQLTVRKDSQSF